MNRDPILIGLTGRAGSGKDAAADHLCREYGFSRAAFADPIRDMLECMLTEAGIDYAWLYEPHLKNVTIPELSFSARHLMQTLGTEWGRTCLYPMFWVRLLERRLGLAPGASPVHDRIVITDVRFLNEANWVYDKGGRLLRLHRDQASTVRQHVSESEFDALPAHVDLVNNGPTLVGLHGLIDGAMADLQVERRSPLE